MRKRQVRSNGELLPKSQILRAVSGCRTKKCMNARKLRAQQTIDIALTRVIQLVVRSFASLTCFPKEASKMLRAKGHARTVIARALRARSAACVSNWFVVLHSQDLSEFLLLKK